MSAFPEARKIYGTLHRQPESVVTPVAKSPDVVSHPADFQKSVATLNDVLKYQALSGKVDIKGRESHTKRQGAAGVIDISVMPDVLSQVAWQSPPKTPDAFTVDRYHMSIWSDGETFTTVQAVRREDREDLVPKDVPIKSSRLGISIPIPHFGEITLGDVEPKIDFDAWETTVTFDRSARIVKLSLKELDALRKDILNSTLLAEDGEQEFAITTVKESLAAYKETDPPEPDNLIYLSKQPSEKSKVA